MGEITAVVLAAGLGTRMKSKFPKVLHKVGGKPLISHVLNALQETGIDDIILVLGHGAREIREILEPKIKVVYQKEQLGTGHALLQVLPLLPKGNEDQCLVLCGDTPLLQGKTLQSLLAQQQRTGARATILSALLTDPTGYGRIVKERGKVLKIVEERDANSEERAIKEINTGTYCFQTPSLVRKLHRLTPANAQGEYYLTDVIQLLAEKEEKVQTYLHDCPQEALGINNRVQLAEAERLMRWRVLEKHMLQGVTILNPENTYIDAQVEIGRDTLIYPGVFLEGKTRIGEDCLLGPNTRIVSSTVGGAVRIISSTVLESSIAQECSIGPYSFLRPGTELGPGVKIGDFVEVKNSSVGPLSKIPHLSYIGDSILGQKVNVGAGTITCNYDGVRKHPTILEDEVFVGSNTNLVAPVRVGQGAYIGAGSTITEDIPAGALAIARGRQRNIAQRKQSRKDKTGEDQNGNL